MKKTNAQLLVIGDGEHREALVNLTKELEIQDLSHFPGFIHPADDLPEIYRLASVFTTASEIETQGLVLLEALASALPVVAANATCIPELIHHGKNGFLIPPRDIEGMAEALTTLICEPSLAKKMGRVGRTIVQDHSITNSLNKHEELYHKLIVQYHEDNKPVAFRSRGQGLARLLSGLDLPRKGR